MISLKSRRCTLALLIGGALQAGACTAMTENQLQAREHRRANFELQFTEFRSQCLAGGKRIYIDALQTVGRDGLPQAGDRYYCI